MTNSPRKEATSPRGYSLYALYARAPTAVPMSVLAVVSALGHVLPHARFLYDMLYDDPDWRPPCSDCAFWPTHDPKSPCLISVTSVIGVLMLLIAVAFVMVMRKRRRQRRAELAAEQEAPAQAAKGAHGTERTTVGDSYTDLEARAADVSHRRISSSPRTFASKRLLSPRRHRCPSAHTRRAKRGRQASPACTALLLGSRLFC